MTRTIWKRGSSVGKEAKYAREFHRGLMVIYRKSLDGTKIHGSEYQPRGLPDYVYYGSVKLFGTSFIGAETKYKKANKRKPMDMDKLLRDEQRKRLHVINKFGGLGLQLTWIEFSVRLRYAVLTRPVQGFSALVPADADRLAVASEDPRPFRDNCIVFKRIGKVKMRDSERYAFKHFWRAQEIWGPVCLE